MKISHKAVCSVMSSKHAVFLPRILQFKCCERNIFFNEDIVFTLLFCVSNSSDEHFDCILFTCS